ncbi:hypothetical protein [Agromyces allii]|uniref:hypothetical protein n=1 Tax=Agromyces allii TaxID=393607 RepID=UPI0012F9A4B1|nr:hypothetical protein [Agromyces allii]
MSDIDADGLPSGPFCPRCGGELDREILPERASLRVALVCPAHGAVSLADPFTRGGA